MARGNGSKHKEGRFRLGVREFFYNEGGETLTRVAQSGDRWSHPGKIQGQVGGSSEKSDLVEIVLLMAGGLQKISFKGLLQPKPLHDENYPRRL